LFHAVPCVSAGSWLHDFRSRANGQRMRIITFVPDGFGSRTPLVPLE
jgi:hypothetical protein